MKTMNLFVISIVVAGASSNVFAVIKPELPVAAKTVEPPVKGEAPIKDETPVKPEPKKPGVLNDLVKPGALAGGAAGILNGHGSIIAGHKEGNGGDHVRATFMKVGRAVVEYLEQTDVGAQVLAQTRLSAAQLSETLTIQTIEVREEMLTDNGGSNTDAIGEPGKITLNKDRWNEHFEKGRDVYYLVFHEMLRALAVNDDDYVYSKALNPFPQTRRISTRISSVLPLIGDELLANAIDNEKVAISGTGCPQGLTGTYLDFDEERNQLEIGLERYVTVTEPTRTLARKACSIAIPVQMPAGKRLVISQLDLSAKAALLPGSSADLNFEAFLAGSTGPKHTRKLSAGTTPVVGRVLIRKTDALRGKCGGADILRLNTSALAQATVPAQGALIEPDRITLSFAVETCQP